MLRKHYPYYLANQAIQANEDLVVKDKYTGEVATRVAMADATVIDAAIERAVQAAEPMRKMAAYERQQVRKAEYFVGRSIGLDKQNELALITSELIRVSKAAAR